MSFSSVIKVVFCFIICFQLQSQNDGISQNSRNQKFKFLYDEERQNLGSISLSYQLPKVSGDNFIGKGFDGKDGFNFRANIYIYKNLFIGYSYGISDFDIINTELVGNYDSTRIEERYFNIGYEFLPISKIRLGVYISLLGGATLSNDIETGFNNRDSGKLHGYGVNIHYELIKNVNVFIDYGWKKIKTDIRVPNEISSFFEKGTYHTINFGLQFNFGRYDLVDALVL